MASRQYLDVKQKNAGTDPNYDICRHCGGKLTDEDHWKKLTDMDWNHCEQEKAYYDDLERRGQAHLAEQEAEKLGKKESSEVKTGFSFT